MFVKDFFSLKKKLSFSFFSRQRLLLGELTVMFFVRNKGTIVYDRLLFLVEDVRGVSLSGRVE